ncbi:dTDP-4-dehydrorhamnose reductase [Methylocella silvestris]|uniref:dTDP-4-dehydrorhamnose reductase n=1 Tax=Methylocella silvestris TaxID=199596 RepID=A0A2J7TFW2_METSI|nr:dTDP-4-dehydrorhamnose reductase [Methylocella silvestris]PNG25657.1 dTDP-4-dehydrorhamnose reductase [Methylocella silvestris]
MILIFGAGGQVGQELQRTAFAKGVACKALSRLEVDIANAADVARALDETAPTLVVNAAAYTKVDLAETEINAAQRGNEIGPGVIGKACAARETPLIHLSTDYVFDGTKIGPYMESDPLAPLGVYGRTKAAGESAVRDAAPLHIILRTSWVYGEFGNNFLKTMLRLARDRDELRVVADQHGCPTSARDIAVAILRLAPRLETGSDLYGLYHFAGVGATSWHGFASRIVEAQANITGRRPKVTAIATADYPTPARRPANSVLDCSLFVRKFGFGAHHWGEETDAVAQALTGKS